MMTTAACWLFSERKLKRRFGVDGGCVEQGKANIFLPEQQWYLGAAEDDALSASVCQLFSDVNVPGPGFVAELTGDQFLVDHPIDIFSVLSVWH